jgi:hypothetical protein
MSNNNKTTPKSIIILQKLTVAQLVKVECSVSYLPMGFILSQFNQAHVTTVRPSLPLHPPHPHYDKVPQMVSSLLVFRLRYCTPLSYYLPNPSDHHWSDLPNSVWWRAQIVKLQPPAWGAQDFFQGDITNTCLQIQIQTTWGWFYCWLWSTEDRLIFLI